MSCCVCVLASHADHTPGSGLNTSLQPFLGLRLVVAVKKKKKKKSAVKLRAPGDETKAKPRCRAPPCEGTLVPTQLRSTLASARACFPSGVENSSIVAPRNKTADDPSGSLSSSTRVWSFSLATTTIFACPSAAGPSLVWFFVGFSRRARC